LERGAAGAGHAGVEGSGRGRRQPVLVRRCHLLQSLTPIYLAWVASFILQVQEAGPTEVEERLERLCLTYETEKTYLISRWK
jgi:hypothetical protein